MVLPIFLPSRENRSRKSQGIHNMFELVKSMFLTRTQKEQKMINVIDSIDTAIAAFGGSKDNLGNCD